MQQVVGGSGIGGGGGPFSTLFNCTSFANSYIHLLQDLPDPQQLFKQKTDLR
jgi:hypothetical protein